MIEITEEERKRAVERSRRMYQTDMQSNIATAEDRGERRGIVKGREEGRAETALNLIRMGFPLTQIAEATGLSLEEINRLRAEN